MDSRAFTDNLGFNGASIGVRVASDLGKNSMGLLRQPAPPSARFLHSFPSQA